MRAHSAERALFTSLWDAALGKPKPGGGVSTPCAVQQAQQLPGKVPHTLHWAQTQSQGAGLGTDPCPAPGPDQQLTLTNPSCCSPPHEGCPQPVPSALLINPR